MRRFADRLREAGLRRRGRRDRRPDAPADARLAEVLRAAATPTAVTVYDVVDDWLDRDLTAAWPTRLRAAARRRAGDAELPDHPRADRRVLRRGTAPRMQHFYELAAPRLDVLVDGDQPVGGRWSLRRGEPQEAAQGPPGARRAAPARRGTEPSTRRSPGCGEAFPDNPGDADGVRLADDARRGRGGVDAFLAERFARVRALRGRASPPTHAVRSSTPLLTPGLNIGLLDPRARASTGRWRSATRTTCRWPALEGFVRQVIGWREYMRATYVAARAGGCAPATSSATPAPLDDGLVGRHRPGSSRSTT